MDSTTNFGGVGFLALFFLILFVLFVRGGNYGGNPLPYAGNPYEVGVGVEGYGLGFEDYKAICESEKQAMMDNAKTNQLIDSSSRQTQELLQTQIGQLAEKMDSYNTQNLRDKIMEQQNTITKLQSEAYVTASLAPIVATLNNIQSNMLVKPSVSGLSTSCNPIITPYSYNNGCGCNCGTL
jgi:hypothetical protein